MRTRRILEASHRASENNLLFRRQETGIPDGRYVILCLLCAVRVICVYSPIFGFLPKTP
jgi:hypothetical protein